jgi:hypothetical protein
LVCRIDSCRARRFTWRRLMRGLLASIYR